MAGSLLAGPFSDRAVRQKIDAMAVLIGPLVEEAAGVHGAPDPVTWLNALLELHEVIAGSRAHHSVAR
jgi:hypothetical protein